MALNNTRCQGLDKSETAEKFVPPVDSRPRCRSHAVVACSIRRIDVRSGNTLGECWGGSGVPFAPVAITCLLWVWLAFTKCIFTCRCTNIKIEPGLAVRRARVYTRTRHSHGLARTHESFFGAAALAAGSKIKPRFKCLKRL